MIALNNVGVRAGAFTLTNVTFTIPSGAFGVVVGAAGSGKTTMLEVIAGVRTASSGTIALYQHTVTDWPPASSPGRAPSVNSEQSWCSRTIRKWPVC